MNILSWVEYRRMEVWVDLEPGRSFNEVVDMMNKCEAYLEGREIRADDEALLARLSADPWPIDEWNDEFKVEHEDSDPPDADLADPQTDDDGGDA